MFVTVANALIDAGEPEKAIEIQDMCQECFPEENFPLESIPLGFSGNDYMVAQIIENYYHLGQKQKASDLAARFGDQLLETAAFYMGWGSLGESEFDNASRILLYVADVCKTYGDDELAINLITNLKQLLQTAPGAAYGLEEVDDTLTVQ
jgi:hypothetical protein